MISNRQTVQHRVGHSGSSRWRVSVGVIAVLAFSLSAASPAQASNFGRYYADDADHYWARVDLTTDGATAANWGVTELNSSTDIDTFNDGTCKSHTDICFYDDDYEATPWIKSVAWWETHDGLAHCNRTANLFGLNGKCDRWYVLFDTADISGYNTTRLWGLGCHEVGHTVGLKHTTDADSCMRRYSDDRTTRLSQHDIDHVDGRYE